MEKDEITGMGFEEWRSRGNFKNLPMNEPARQEKTQPMFNI